MVTTRTRDYGSGDDEDEIGEHRNASVREEKLADKRNRWAALLREKLYLTVINEVLEEELGKYTNNRVFNEANLMLITRECMLILASAPRIFEAAVEGMLALRFTVDQELQAEYEEIRQRADVQPSIYMHLLADEGGVAPSASQYMIIRDIVTRYIDEAEVQLASLVDNISPPYVALRDTSAGYRKYLCTARRSPRRVRVLERFCEGIRKRWEETPPQERDLPLNYPPGECGYAINAPRRLLQHRSRISSNYIMNLVEDICTLGFRDLKLFTHLFRMHQFIIYLIFNPQQVEVAEMFCSGLLQVWVDKGGGFNHYPAGLSNASARRVSEDEWNGHEIYVRENSPLETNIRHQRDTIDDVVLKLHEQAAALLWEVFQELAQYEGSEESESDETENELRRMDMDINM
ncbi:uncharacterized protein BDR25DRAFT_341655 [Lindgomyces ingoldianus]|uniref:Uncharacterized protein n=1 Tax=Lindgomyces ingoldianus TaxID=673940 RepID=A0ACB6R335_9PLEO|nr:uncharacterized protein BDR25DRAFT_341655 [Lindgomyces ingoldianus]KAF2472851.1 hypothetical protein BDR25DRAFT_341655 [Lindgomyces ingoldianus]